MVHYVVLPPCSDGEGLRVWPFGAVSARDNVVGVLRRHPAPGARGALPHHDERPQDARGHQQQDGPRPPGQAPLLLTTGIPNTKDTRDKKKDERQLLRRFQQEPICSSR